MSTSYERVRENPSVFVEEILGVEHVFEYQQEFLDTDADRRVFRAGRQVGKSRVASWLALHHAMTHADSTVLITADALRQSSELFAQIKSEINQSDIPGDQWGIDRETQTIVEFDNGSRIICVPTGRDGSKIRGYTADFVIVDEAAFIEDNIFEDVLEPMLFVEDGTMVLCSTPFGKSGYFFEKSQKARFDEASRWHETHVSTYDNPRIDDDEIEDYKEGKSHMTVQQEVYGEFVEDADSFFPSELVKSCFEDDVKREGEKVYLGVDLARHGTDHTVLTLVDDQGNVFACERYEQINLTDSVERIKTLNSLYDFETILVDEMGLGGGPMEMLEGELGRKVEGIKLSLQKKQSVYQSAKAEMETGQVEFYHNEDLMEQLQSMGYSQTKNGNLSIHARDGGRDDFVDSLCLALWAADTTSSRGRGRGSRQAYDMGSF